MTPDSDDSLIFGLFAVRTGRLDRGQLAEGMGASARDPSRSLADHLVTLGHLSTSQRAEIEMLVPLYALLSVGTKDTAGSTTNPRRLKLEDTLVDEGPPRERADSAQAADPGVAECLDVPETAANVVAETDEDRSTSSPDSIAFEPEPPVQTGGYQVVRPHAEGGLGEVLVAVDLSLNREVALKRLQEEHADDPVSQQRFLREAEITGKLEHPGVVPVYGMGRSADGRLFYAMRFLEGSSLKEAIAEFHSDEKVRRDSARRSVELRKLLRRFVDVCNTIEFAHSRGVIHRDIKPSNVIIGAHGQTMVVDWGLAKALGETDPAQDERRPNPHNVAHSLSGSSETLPGFAVGTPAYMSPEQAAGELGKVGVRSDVYSLGATLYCILVGKPPFQGPADRVVVGVQRGAFARPRAVDPKVDATLEAICLKAMSFHPEDRQASAKELAHAIELWEADATIPGIREPLGRRLSRWERRNRSLVRWVGAALVVVSAISVTAAFLVMKARGREHLALQAETKQKAYAESQRLLAETRQAAAQELACTLLIDRALGLSDEQEYGKALLWLGRALIELPPGRQDLEQQIRVASQACRRLATAPVAILEHPGGLVTHMAYRMDGRVIATGDQIGLVRMWDAATGQVRGPGLSHPGAVLAIRFASASHVFIVATDAALVQAHDGESGAALGPPIPIPSPIASVAIASNGQSFVVGTTDGKTIVYGIDGHTLGAELRHNSPVVAVSFSADDRFVLTGTVDGLVRISEAQTGRVRDVAIRHSGPLTTAIWRPDGEAVLTAGADGLARLWDANTGKPLGPPLEHRGLIRQASFRPRGDLVLTTGMSPTARVWNPITGVEEVTSHDLLRHQSYVLSAAFDPKGSTVLTGSQDRTARLWNLDRMTSQGNTLFHTRELNDVAYSPDGRTLLTRGDPGMPMLWRIGTADPMDVEFSLTGSITALALSPDSRQFLAAGDPGSVRMRDVATGRPSGAPFQLDRAVLAVSLSPDGRYALTASVDRQGRFWDVATGVAVGSPMTTEDEIRACAFHPDGKLAVIAGRDRLARFFEVPTGKPIGPPIHVSDSVLAVGFTRDGSRLVTGCVDGSICFWDVTTRREVGHALQHTNSIRGLAFHPNGQLLASGSIDGTARIWEIATGRQVGPPLVHDGWVNGLAFSPDGRMLATGCLDGSLRFWDVTTGRRLGPSFWKLNTIWCLEFLSDGSGVLFGSADAAVHRFPVPHSASGDKFTLIHQARATSYLKLADDGTYRPLTPGEWKAELDLGGLLRKAESGE